MSASTAADVQESFDGSVRRLVADALLQGADFPTLVYELPGVDPQLVIRALEQMREDDAIGVLAREACRQARTLTPTAAPTRERPIPHPLEFYWAHDPASVNGLTSLLGQISAGETIAYLGAPNVFAAAVGDLPGRRHVLLDRSVPRTQSLRATGLSEVLLVDLLSSEIPQLQAGTVLTDPPWYPDHIRGFLWSAAQVACVGAKVWACFPPAGTRPGVSQETKALMAWAEQGGLASLSHESAKLRYLSSPFELASLRAAHIGGVPLNWRCGDLVCFELSQPFSQPRPPRSADEETWLPFVIDEIPVWVRDGRDRDRELGDGLLEGLVDGDILNSVSRRHPVRGSVDVWSSLNRVWASSHPAAIQAICRALAEATDPQASVSAELGRRLRGGESTAVARAVELLHNVVATERAEHGL
jgi:hypothetical protein